MEGGHVGWALAREKCAQGRGDGEGEGTGTKAKGDECRGGVKGVGALGLNARQGSGGGGVMWRRKVWHKELV